MALCVDGTVAVVCSVASMTHFTVTLFTTVQVNCLKNKQKTKVRKCILFLSEEFPMCRTLTSG